MATKAVQIIINGRDQSRAAFQSVNSSLKSMELQAGNTSSKLQTLLASAGKLKVAAAGVLAAIGAKTLLQKIIGSAADAESTSVAMNTLVGDIKVATQLIKELRQFGAETPFEFPELADAAKKLIAFGIAPRFVTSELRRIGDIASGIGVPIGELSEIYGKARVQGRLFAEDINQLTGRGIPVIQEFARQFGVADSEVRKLVESGKIGFPQLQQAFVSLTSQGGKFMGMMQAQSKTLSGMWGTLKDDLGSLAREIGESMTPALKDGLGAISEMVQEVQLAAEAFKEWADAAERAKNIQPGLAGGQSPSQGNGGGTWRSTVTAPLDYLQGAKGIAKWWQSDFTGLLASVAERLAALDQMGFEVIGSSNGEPPAFFKSWAEELRRVQKEQAKAGSEILADRTLGETYEQKNTRRLREAEAAKRAKEQQEREAERDAKLAAAVSNFVDRFTQGGKTWLDALRNTGENLESGVGGFVKSLKMDAQVAVARFRKRLERADEIRDRIADIVKANRTPQEILNEGLAEVARLRGFGLDEENASRQRAQLRKDFERSTAVEKDAVVRQGLAPIESRFLSRAPGQSDPLIEQKKATEKQTKKLDEIAVWIKRLTLNAETNDAPQNAIVIAGGRA